MSRPTWDEYFLNIMTETGKRATCDRGKSGCIIVRDHHILAGGYVGSPAGLPHCDEAGHLMSKVLNEDGSVSNHCIRTVHAEQNAICQAAKLGISLYGATMYCNMEPCRTCAMMIINVGINRVVAMYRYHRAESTRKMFHESGIVLDVIKDVEADYTNKHSLGYPSRTRIEGIDYPVGGSPE